MRTAYRERYDNVANSAQIAYAKDPTVAGSALLPVP